jgi:hypothetical protein
MTLPSRDSRPLSSRRSSSGLSRRIVRIATDVSVVVARDSGEKAWGRVVDLSLGGMHVASDCVPAYGERVRLLVQLDPTADWLILPARVRWFTSRGFGVEFDGLDVGQQQAVLAFVERRAS